MRWFKHLTCSHDDGKLCRLRDEFGAEGYGVWWIILERIAGEMNGPNFTTSLQVSLKNWSKSCGISVKKFQKIAEFLAENENLSVEMSGQLCKIDCPNLLKYRDEYSRKSGQHGEEYPERVRHQIQKQKQNTKKEAAASKVTSDRGTTNSSIPVAAAAGFSNQEEPESNKNENLNSNPLAILKWFKIKNALAKEIASEYSLKHIRKAASITVERMKGKNIRNPSGLFLTILQDETLSGDVYENLQAEAQKHETKKAKKEGQF